MLKRGICCILVLCLCAGIATAGDWELRFTTSVGTNDTTQTYFVVGTDTYGLNSYNASLDVAASPGDPGMWLEKNAGVRVISDYRKTLHFINPTQAVYTLNGTNITNGVNFNFLNVADLPPIVGNITVRWYYNSTMPVATEIGEANPSFWMSPDAFNASASPFLPNITVTYTAPPAPVANFTANVTSGDAPLTVQFTNTSTGYELYNPTWVFGDGSVMVVNQETPIHTFDNPGMYDVSLTIINPGGSNATTKTAFITVMAPPVVNITANQTIGSGPLTVNFTDLSASGLPGSTTLEGWEWDFGDGTANGTERNVTHTYTTFGRFNVTLTVTDNSTRSSTRVFENYITSLAPGPDIGNPLVTSPGGVLNAPVLLNLYGSATASDAFAIDSWYWQFSDGTNYTGRNITKNFPVKGIYYFNLTVTDNQTPGQSSLWPGPGGTASIAIPGPLPVPDFTATPTSARMPVTIRFTDLSTGSNISAWAWDFNSDGVVDSTEQNPSWVPVGPFPAHYSVTLNVTDENGQNQTTKSQYLYINEVDDNDGPDYPPVTRATPTPTVKPADVASAAGETVVTITAGPASEGSSGEDAGTEESSSAPSPSAPSSSTASPPVTNTPAASGPEEPVPTESPLGSLAGTVGLAGAGAVLFRRR
jgi:PKD repeat protein